MSENNIREQLTNIEEGLFDLYADMRKKHGGKFPIQQKLYDYIQGKSKQSKSEPKVVKSKGGLTQNHVISGTALATGLGLGAHYLYKKYKKNKKIRDSMKKKM